MSVAEAAVDAAELGTLRKAQVYFKASRTGDWYFVEMEPREGSRLSAILPKPLAETDRVDYYVFFLTGSFGTWQSEEFSVRVSETGCEAFPGPATTAPASLTLRATVLNQSPIPPGFQAHGISGLVAGNTVSLGSAAAGGGAASRGLSGMTVGLVGGVAAVAGVAAVVTNASNSDTDNASPDAGQEPAGGITSTSSSPSPSPSPAPNPAPSPAPSVLDVSGTWLTTDRIIESCSPSLVGRISDTGSVIQQDGTRLNLSRSHEGYSENHIGTIDTAGNILLSGQFVDDGDSGTVRIEATTTTGSDMRGTRTHFYPAQLHDPRDVLGLEALSRSGQEASLS